MISVSGYQPDVTTAERDFTMSELLPPTGRFSFDHIRHVRADGSEFWSAREMGAMMGYADWRNLRDAVSRAMAACVNAGSNVDDAFTQVAQLVAANNLGPQSREDYELSRYGSYLVAMNGDPRKPEVAKAQAYFAIQTRVAETAAARPTVELSRKEVLLLALAAEERAEIAEDRVKELAPSAEAWTALADAEGDYSVRDAAQVLAREGVEIGERRLFALIRQLKWVDRTDAPYQRYVDQGLMARRIRRWDDPRDGKSYSSWQLRITVKGLQRLRGIVALGEA